MTRHPGCMPTLPPVLFSLFHFVRYTCIVDVDTRMHMSWNQHSYSIKQMWHGIRSPHYRLALEACRRLTCTCFMVARMCSDSGSAPNISCTTSAARCGNCPSGGGPTCSRPLCACTTVTACEQPLSAESVAAVIASAGSRSQPAVGSKAGYRYIIIYIHTRMCSTPGELCTAVQTQLALAWEGRQPNPEPTSYINTVQ